MFLMQKGFPHLALEYVAGIREDFEPKDVLACTEGVVLLESLGRGNDARKCFEAALEINPCYPQAARLAGSFALTYEDAARYNDLFFEGMQRCVSETPRKKGGFFAALKKARDTQENGNIPGNDVFPRFSNLCMHQYKAGKSTALHETKDIVALHAAQYLELYDKGLPAKQLSVASIITEIVREGLAAGTSVPDDFLRECIRNSMELGVKAGLANQAKQKEYAQYGCPHDDIFAQDVVKNADYYLETYDPYDIVVLNWQASALRELERYEECIEKCDLAIEIQPDDYYFHYTNKALSLIELGRNDDACALFPVIEREASGKDPSILGKIKDTLAQDERIHGLTPDDLAQYYYHFTEGAGYAARDEFAECRQTGRASMLEDFTTRFAFWEESMKRQGLMELFLFYTPACIYEHLASAGTNGDNLLKLLLDAFPEAVRSPGFAGEMFAELCWMFAVSPKYQVFGPLKSLLTDSIPRGQAGSENVTLALRRILPPLYRALAM
jgi:tetratricopeptide (TPR) repeat protein